MTGKDLTAVDDVVKALRALDSDKLAGDPIGMQQLLATALDKMKKLEYDLRKRADTANEQLYISGSEDVPKAWESIINDYYRSLGKDEKGRKIGRAVPGFRSSVPVRAYFHSNRVIGSCRSPDFSFSEPRNPGIDRAFTF